MFPLGSVLFPLGVLPLHVFEPRYLTMIAEALADDGTFGVTLIERGSEIGGGEERFSLGTVARIVRAAEVDENRLAVVALGVSRIRVTEWLADAPYPAAMVEDYPDGIPTPELSSAVGDARRTLRRLMALASELGANVGSNDVDLPEDPRAAVWTLCSVAPLEQLDRQRLLEIEDPLPRTHALVEMLGERTDIMQAQLAGG
jgi:Lon protease-like protein